MRSRRFWLIAAGVWLLFGLITGFQVWVSMLSHHHSVPLLMTYYVVLWEAWLTITYIVVVLVRRWPVIPPGVPNILKHIGAAFTLGTVHIIYWIVIMVWLRPFDMRTARLNQIDLIDCLASHLPLELTLYATVLAAVLALDYYEKYRERTIEMAQLEVSLHQARLHALELQLQPHFLFNTLNATAALVRTGKDEEAVKMIAGLSDLLRYTLDRSGAQHVTLDEESNTLRNYLEIQRVRFADRLAFDIDIADDVKRAEVPTLILQPLAENALRHGIARTAGEGRIAVRAFRERNFLHIEMFNTGTLDTDARLGIGLRNTIERLKQMYGDKHQFDLRTEGGGVLASLMIPWSEAT
ncbi:MAG TPA: histidine kinase [Thermoanaerobaculia bacterium]